MTMRKTIENANHYLEDGHVMAARAPLTHGEVANSLIDLTRAIRAVQGIMQRLERRLSDVPGLPRHEQQSLAHVHEAMNAAVNHLLRASADTRTAAETHGRLARRSTVLATATDIDNPRPTTS